MDEDNKKEPVRETTTAEKFTVKLTNIYKEIIALTQEFISLVPPETRSKIKDGFSGYTLDQLVEESDTLATLAQYNAHLQLIQANLIGVVADYLQYNKKMSIFHCVLILLIQTDLFNIQLNCMDVYIGQAMIAFEYQLMPSQVREELNAGEDDALHIAKQKYRKLLQGFYKSGDMPSALDAYYDLDDTCFLSAHDAVSEENRQSYDPNVDKLLASIESKLSAVEESIPSESGEYWLNTERVKVNSDNSKLQKIVHTYPICTKAFLHLQICEAEFHDILLRYNYSWFPDETLEAIEAVQDHLRKLRDSIRNHVKYCHDGVQSYFLPTAIKFKNLCFLWKTFYTEEFKREAPKSNFWNESEQRLRESFRKICGYYHADDIANAILGKAMDIGSETSPQDIDLNSNKQESSST